MKKSIPSPSCYTAAFDWSGDDIALVMADMQSYSGIIESNVGKSIALQVACKKNNIDAVNYLLKFPNIVQDIAIYDNYALRVSYYSSFLDIAVILLGYPVVANATPVYKKQTVIAKITPLQAWRVFDAPYIKRQLSSEQQRAFIENKILQHPVWLQVTAQMHQWRLYINRQFSLGKLPALPPEIKRHIGLTLLKSSHPGISNDLAKALVSAAPQKQLQTLLMS